MHSIYYLILLLLCKKVLKHKNRNRTLIDENDELITDNFKIAEMLRLQYEKAFSKPLESAQIRNSQTFFEDYNPESSSLPFVHITHQDVLEAIDSLSPNAAHGPDSFPAVLLKKENILSVMFLQKYFVHHWILERFLMFS